MRKVLYIGFSGKLFPDRLVDSINSLSDAGDIPVSYDYMSGLPDDVDEVKGFDLVVPDHPSGMDMRKTYSLMKENGIKKPVIVTKCRMLRWRYLEEDSSLDKWYTVDRSKIREAVEELLESNSAE